MKKRIILLIVALLGLLTIVFATGCHKMTTDEYNQAAYEYNRSHPNSKQFGYHYDVGGKTYTTSGW